MTTPTFNNLSEVDDEIVKILEKMIEDEQNITVRGVIRNHSSLKAPSSITRNVSRTEIVNYYINKQQELKSWQKRVGKTSKENLSKSLAEKDIKIAELERKVELLTASHVAMIRAVGELGGSAKWAAFFKDYQAIRNELEKMGAMGV
ncbi:MAG: hypothetical protein SFU55_00570 [Methylophilus sp.]|nr:hypothetical protein [Methylophilus sp.]